MKSFQTVFLAAIIGAATEFGLGVISVISILTGGMGPCGPTGDAPTIVRVIHQPGFWVADFLADEYSLLHAFWGIALTTILLSVLAYAVLRIRQSEKEFRQTAATPKPPDNVHAALGTPSNPNGGDNSKSAPGSGSAMG